MLKALVRKLYHRFAREARTLDDLVSEIRLLLPEEKLRLKIRSLKFPQTKPMTEMQELLALRSLLDAEPFLNYLENRQYNYLTAHIQEPTPEGRLEIRGRYLEVGELLEGIKTSKEKVEEKGVEQAVEQLSKNE